MRSKGMSQLASMIVLALWVSSARAAAEGVTAATLTAREIIAQAQAAADDRSVLPAARSAPNPALFVARDADSTMYLFGTLHVLIPGDAWSTPAIELALAQSEEIWTEVELSPVGMADAQRLMRARGMAPDDEPLSGRLTPEQAQRLDATLQTYGVSRQAIERMRPWLAALTLSLAPVMRAGYDPAAGVDRGIGAMGGVQGKKMRAFETAEQQVDLLAGLSERLQMQLLLESMDEAARAATMVDALAAAWLQGDLETLAGLVNDDMRRAYPELFEVLFVRRNEAWVATLLQEFAGSGTDFVAVGAGHLLGAEGLVERLRAEGVRVERVGDPAR